jgi:hypothetical protein
MPWRGAERRVHLTGRKTTIFYDPPDTRGVTPELSGESPMEPGTLIQFPDHAGKVVAQRLGLVVRTLRHNSCDPIDARSAPRNHRA